MEYSDKRDSIMNTTLELVAENGFHGSPISLIAKQAGVSTGTIYHYFESKDILICETYSLLEEQIIEAIRIDYPEGCPILDRFMHIWKMLVYCFINAPTLFRFFEQVHNSPYGTANRRDRLLGKKDDIVMAMFEDALNQKIVKDLPLSALFALAFGPLIQISRDHILGLIELDEITIGQIVESCWVAVRR